MSTFFGDAVPLRTEQCRTSSVSVVRPVERLVLARTGETRSNSKRGAEEGNAVSPRAFRWSGHPHVRVIGKII